MQPYGAAKRPSYVIQLDDITLQLGHVITGIVPKLSMHRSNTLTLVGWQGKADATYEKTSAHLPGLADFPIW